MNSYIITKEDKRRAFISLYFTVLGLIALSIATALAFVHIGAFHNSYYTVESTPEKPQGTLTAFILTQIPFLAAWFYFRLGSRLGNDGKMNFAVILSLATGANANFYFYNFGWQKTTFLLGIAFVMFNLAVFLALFIKKDFSKHKKFFLLFGTALVMAALVLNILKITFFDSTIFYAISLLGCILVFLDTQDWWLKLDDVPDQENFDRMYCHTMINLVAGFWVIHVSTTVSKLLVKLLVSIYVLPKR